MDNCLSITFSKCVEDEHHNVIGISHETVQLHETMIFKTRIDNKLLL